MKGAVFEGKHMIVIKEDLTKPTIEEDEVLIKTKKVAICGSDVGSYEVGGPYFPGNVLGHEFSGEVVDVGAKVKKIKVGSRVTVNPQLPCNKCYYCLHDQENMCKIKNYALGTTENGAMREFLNVKAERVHLLPDNVSFEHAAMVEPISVALYAVIESDFQIGQTATVIGAGPIGLFVIQVLKAAGADKIFVLEPVEFKQKKALELGANNVYKPTAWKKITRQVDNNIGTDHVYDCVGLSTTFITSLNVIKKGGKITLIGMHASSFEINNILYMTTNNITVRGVYGYNQEIFRIAINLLEQQKILVDPLITKKIKLEDVPAIFEKLSKPEHDELKVIVELD